jgi:hypothetical protein
MIQPKPGNYSELFGGFFQPKPGNYSELFGGFFQPKPGNYSELDQDSKDPHSHETGGGGFSC